MSLTKTTNSMILGAYANVLDYGADLTGTADSTSAFVAALAAENRVYVPKGTYLIADVYVAGSKVLFGDGMESSILKAAGNCTHGVLYAGQPFTRVMFLSIDGNKSNFTANGFKTDGTLFSFANFCQELDSVHIQNCSGYGVYAKGANAFALVNSRVTACDNTLVYLDSARKYLLDNNDLELSSSAAVEVVDTVSVSLAATGGTISNNWFEQLTTADVVVINAYNQFIFGNKFNTTVTTNSCIRFKASCDSAVVTQNNFQNGPSTKIQIDSGAQNIKVSFNRGVSYTSPTTYDGLIDNGSNTLVEGITGTGASANYCINSPKFSAAGWTFDKATSNLYGANATFGPNYAFTLIQANSALRLRVGNTASGQNIEFGDANGASSWQQGHITLGTYHLWVDATGKLRIKTGAPTSDTDGTVVGTQT